MEFVIVRAPKEPKVKVKKTKYGRLFNTMKDLKVGDHVVVVPNVEERLINSRLHNVHRGLKGFTELLPRRKFEMSTARSQGSSASDIIIKRLE